ncbi:hypothetical protein F4808DRAFT_458910 [Astrocystis sublimbata]|nr:hypothetical protein F4808DRAFT_458910 [Astrocystis sublimbata]
MQFLAIVAAVAYSTTMVAAHPPVPTSASDSPVPSSTANATTSGHEPINGRIDSFEKTCNLFFQTPSPLFGAICPDRSGCHRFTALDLDLCIANQGGKLVAADNGNFSQNCAGTNVYGPEPLMDAYCWDGQRVVPTTINLGDFIDNIDGYLTCLGHQGTIPDKDDNCIINF